MVVEAQDAGAEVRLLVVDGDDDVEDGGGGGEGVAAGPAGRCSLTGRRPASLPVPLPLFLPVPPLSSPEPLPLSLPVPPLYRPAPLVRTSAPGPLRRLSVVVMAPTFANRAVTPVW